MEIRDVIHGYLAEGPRWTGPASALTPDYPLIENELLDSLGIFELVGFIEDRFEIEIGDDDLVPENFESINTVSDLVGRSLPH